MIAHGCRTGSTTTSASPPVDDCTPRPDDVLVCTVGDVASKRNYCRQLIDKGSKLVKVVHPTVAISRNVTLGRGMILCPHATLSGDLRLGGFVSVGTHTTVAAGAAVRRHV